MLPLPDTATSSALDEETARAELYGVLAQLFYAPPAPELLAKLRVAATEAPAAGGFLEEPWRATMPCPTPKTTSPTYAKSCVT
jgi:TorA maturation chaperone TorD